jgi:hypothetical protein
MGIVMLAAAMAALTALLLSLAGQPPAMNISKRRLLLRLWT